ncbi:hypothetical protein WHI96_10930 [Pseudonocardia tropica]|uniref:Sigma-70, region 4 n=1 Tax=Pseudonocardia tropica TaxID=681289 RepID=A0ABV1JWR7_9PSEU
MTTTERANDGADLRDGSADDADAALTALAAQLEASVAELSSARERVAELQELRSQGLSWRAIVPREARPLIVETLTRTLDGLGAVGGRFRREEAVALHGEGETIAGIGRLFGVSRQRVSAYLQEHQQLLERCAAREDRPES